MIDWHKSCDFGFIGAFRIDPRTVARRSWIINFIREYFGESSYLQFTDQATKQGYENLGDFDDTLLVAGFVPKEVPVERRNWFDEQYFRIMCISQFVLCLGGDKNWSMRFYKSLMCKAIPVLLDRTPFRTADEARLPYKYLFAIKKMEYRPEWAEHNYEVFKQYHTLEYLRRSEPPRQG